MTFRVTERPLVRNVTVEGNDKLKKEEVEGALRVRPHTILDPEKARQGIEAARKLYADKGYLDAKIDYRHGAGRRERGRPASTGSTSRAPVRVEDIDFEGNKAFSSRKLRGLLQTKKAWILTPFTGAGNLNRDVLRTDVERLTAWYYDNGYVTVRVDEPKVERRGGRPRGDHQDRRGRAVPRRNGRGRRRRPAGRRDAACRPTWPPRRARSSAPAALRDDVQRLTERLSEDGYAFANVEPATDVDPPSKMVNVTFQVERGSPVTVDRIEVTGNTKTRDNVIRREMRLQEQELFSATKLRKSREALQRVGFFQSVNVTTRKSPVADDRMDVVVDVKEAQTGSFSAGAGFSSADNLLFNVRIQENNLFGRGQRLVANVDVGSIRRNIILSFTEPYFRGTPLTVGFDAFSWRLEFDDFDRAGTGASIQATYPVTAFGWTSLWGVPLDDGPDRRRLPHRAGGDQRHQLRRTGRHPRGAGHEPDQQHHAAHLAQHAEPLLRPDGRVGAGPVGRGRRAGRRRSSSRRRRATRWYYTFLHSKRFGDFTYSLGLPGGYGVGETGVDGDELPLFERYFPGGINSIRGFEPAHPGPARVPQEHPRRAVHQRARRRHLAAHPQQRDHLPAGAGDRPEGRRLRRRRQRLRRGRERSHRRCPLCGRRRHAVAVAARSAARRARISVQHEAGRPDAAAPVLVRWTVPVLKEAYDVTHEDRFFVGSRTAWNVVAAGVMTGLALAAPVRAEQMRIAVVDMQRALNECDAGKQAKDPVRGKFEKAQDQLKKEREDLDKSREEFEKAPSC